MLAYSVNFAFGTGLSSATNVAFPDDQLVLGKYLGPSIDVRPAMMQHDMKANGGYEDQSIVHQLTPKECMSLAMQKEQHS